MEMEHPLSLEEVIFHEAMPYIYIYLYVPCLNTSTVKARGGATLASLVDEGVFRKLTELGIGCQPKQPATTSHLIILTYQIKKMAIDTGLATFLDRFIFQHRRFIEEVGTTYILRVYIDTHPRSQHPKSPKPIERTRRSSESLSSFKLEIPFSHRRRQRSR